MSHNSSGINWWLISLALLCMFAALLLVGSA